MATAIRTRGLDRAAWEARARELAEQRHTVGTARWLGEGDDGAVLLAVPAQSRGVDDYLVRVWAGFAECDCPAGRHGQPCKHIGAGLHLLDQRERAIARASAMTAAQAARLLAIYGWV